MDEKKIKNELAEKLLYCHRNLLKNPSRAPSCFVGFDGFTDEIIQAVRTRIDKSHFVPMDNMSEFGERVSKAAGKSCNIELVRLRTKLGGNAPIFTDALLHGGHRVTFAGAIGTPRSIEPLFQEMASKCELAIPLAPSGHSDAIEFKDGKIILGKYESVQGITFELLLSQIDERSLIQTLDRCDLFMSANWTMLPKMTEILQKIAAKIVPSFSLKRENARWMFVDLADPAKRTDNDLSEAMTVLRSFERPFRVILGLNEAEALRIGSVFGINLLRGSIQNLMNLAAHIQKKLQLYKVVIHATEFAVSADEAESISCNGPYIEKIMLTTGGGDNFNAGFCNALLYNLSSREMLMSGVATSGYYVRTGKSPTISELAAFLREWSDHEKK